MAHGAPMLVRIPKGAGRSSPPPPSVSVAGLGRLRKIALIGSAPTVDLAPWYDPTWEIWSHSICVGRCKRVDRIFEMHPEVTWRDTKKPQWPNYLEWLQRCPTPIYMLEKHHDIPASVRYPRERLFAECAAMFAGKVMFGNQADLMIALALSEGVTHLGLYGTHYVDPVKDGDRFDQLLSFRTWLGVAAGKGVHLVIPEGNPVFDLPREIYGIESHSTKDKYQAKLDKQKQVLTRKDPAAPLTAKTLMPFDPKDVHSLKPLPWNEHIGTRPMPENWAQFEKDDDDDGSRPTGAAPDGAVHRPPAQPESPRRVPARRTGVDARRRRGASKGGDPVVQQPVGPVAARPDRRRVVPKRRRSSGGAAVGGTRRVTGRRDPQSQKRRRRGAQSSH